MNPSIAAEVERLHQLKTVALRIRYREVFGEESRSSNRQSCSGASLGACRRPGS